MGIFMGIPMGISMGILCPVVAAGANPGAVCRPGHLAFVLIERSIVSEMSWVQALGCAGLPQAALYLRSALMLYVL